jgi:hypothetical protein
VGSVLDAVAWAGPEGRGRERLAEVPAGRRIMFRIGMIGDLTPDLAAP